jgi:hypothetical protein
LFCSDPKSRQLEKGRLAIANFWGSRALTEFGTSFIDNSSLTIELLHSNHNIDHEHQTEGKRLLHAVEEYCWYHWE